MASIFKTFARAMQGKPLFDQNEADKNFQQQVAAPLNGQWTPDAPHINGVQLPPQAQPQPLQHTEPHEPVVNSADSRTFPVVRVRHTAVRLFNGQMEVRVRIINESPFQVDVHKAELLGTTTDIRHPLRPGEDREFLLYHGPCMRNNAYHEMDLEYKTELGVYFKSIHDITYQMNADRSFRVDELRLRLPIRHVAG